MVAACAKAAVTMLLLISGSQPAAEAHAVMRSPTARAGMAPAAPALGTKLAVFPVPAGVVAGIDRGGCPLDATRAAALQAPEFSYQPGNPVQVLWDVTLSHSTAPGVTIDIRYSVSNLGAFGAMSVASGPGLGTTAANLLVDEDNISAGNVAGAHKLSVAIPADAPDGLATIRWIWASQDDGGYYVGCSEILVDSTNAPGTTLSSAASLSALSQADPGGGGAAFGVAMAWDDAVIVFLIALTSATLCFCVCGYSTYRKWALRNSDSGRVSCLLFFHCLLAQCLLARCLLPP